jgi:UDP-N-acetylglucosamine:LPS N-acetylglucosamine transferase
MSPDTVHLARVRATRIAREHGRGDTDETSASAKSPVLLVASSGGHLLQLRQLASLWSREDTRWVTFRRSDAESMLDGERVTWAYYPTNRHAWNALRNLRLAARLIKRERPRAVVTTGAGVAVPFAIIAWLAGINIVYIESMARIGRPSLTGRLIYPLATHFYVQWPDLLSFFPRATCYGTLFDLS